MAVLHHKPARCLGFDVAKDSIVVHDGTALVGTVANTRRAIRALLAHHEAALAVCEPTGGHERRLLEECRRAGLPVHRADTLKLKAFIRSFGTLGKSDAIDAAKLAAYGLERWASLPLWTPPEAHEERLKALVRRRDDLLALKVAEQNRAKAPTARALQASFKAVLAVIERQIAAIDAAIARLAAESAVLKQRIAVCTAMPGIGQRTATALLATMPELGSMTRRQAAALAGMAPHPNESGLTKGYRKMRGGRSNVASILFLPALQAANGRGEFATFYKRLVDNGKKPISAVAAVSRKIIITLNARLRDNQNLQS